VPSTAEKLKIQVDDLDSKFSKEIDEINESIEKMAKKFKKALEDLGNNLELKMKESR
jgi:aspartate/tyrosine/aromatic aminotransferase